MSRFYWWIFVVVFAACSSAPAAAPTPMQSLESCEQLVVNTDLTCLSAGTSAMLLQSPSGSQAAINLKNANITLDGTLYLHIEFSQKLTIATIEGIGVAGAFGATRIVQPGAQVTLPLGGDDGLQVTGAPSLPVPFDPFALQNAPLASLERPVNLPPPIAPPPDYTPPPTFTPVPVSTAASAPANATSTPASGTATPCTVREDWGGRYTIRRGDNLSAIARQFNISLAELQAGNCITNPNRISAGQVLRVPAPPNTPTSALTALSSPTESATVAPNFAADQTVIQPGQCTTVRWSFENVSAVYFENELTTKRNARQVCPLETTTYTMLVTEPDGRQLPYFLTIEVAAPTATWTPLG